MVDQLVCRRRCAPSAGAPFLIKLAQLALAHIVIAASSALIATWVAGVTLVGLHWLLGFLTYHLDWFDPIVKGNQVLLINDGEVQREGMREGSLTRHDLEQALRAGQH